MVVTDPRGSLADVYAARRALSAKSEPPMLFYVAWAAVFAVFCGSKSSQFSLVGAAALPAASRAATWWQYRRSRLICPSRIRLFTRRVFVLASLLSMVAMVVVLAIATTLAAALWHRVIWMAGFSPRGPPRPSLARSVVFTVPIMAGFSLPSRLDPSGIAAPP